MEIWFILYTFLCILHIATYTPHIIKLTTQHSSHHTASLSPHWLIVTSTVFLPNPITLEQALSDPKFNYLYNFDSENDFDSPYDHLHSCKYIAPSDVTDLLQPNLFSLLSYNIRSLTGKWDEFSCSIENCSKVII